MPVRWLLTLFNALAIGTILVILGLALLFFFERALINGLQETVQNRAYSAAESVLAADADEVLAPDGVENLTLEGVFIVVRDAEGGVISQTAALSTNVPENDRVWRAALKADLPAAGTTRLSSEAPEYVYAIPVSPAGNDARVVEAGASYGSVSEALVEIRRVLAAGILIALLFAVLGAYFLARAALAPVDAVTKAASAIGDGNLSKRLPVENPRDEIGRLALAINALLARLQAAFERREEALARQRRFVADAGHELRTPLTSISGYAGVLKRWGLEDRKTANESVEAIERESRRMQDFVEDLLTLARGDEKPRMKLEETDLAALAREATEDARATADSDLAIDFEAPERGVRACLDPAKVRQVASILLDNAVKYTEPGGRVQVRAFRRDGFAVLEVTDTGVGIPPEHLPLVFERFHRVDGSRSGGGSGLGLSIARQIADLHGGDIEVESTPGRGSSFRLLLPAREDP